MIGLKAGVLWGGDMRKDFYRAMWQTIKIEQRAWVAPITNTYRGEKHDDYVHVAPLRNQSNQSITHFIEVHQPSADVYREQDFQDQFCDTHAQSTHAHDMLPQLLAFAIATTCYICYIRYISDYS